MKTCILVTGIPASGKSTLSRWLGKRMNLPVISKDDTKELLFDDIGFASRAEKVQLGVAAMHVMYDTARRLMRCGQSFILENNFENASRVELDELLIEYGYQALTIMLTGDYRVIYQRFVERDRSAGRHRGHVVNDCYPEKEPGRIIEPLAFENFVEGIQKRGMDTFTAGECLTVDVTDWHSVDDDAIVQWILRRTERAEDGV